MSAWEVSLHVVLAVGCIAFLIGALVTDQLRFALVAIVIALVGRALAKLQTRESE